jgi:hypothetical protein
MRKTTPLFVYVLLLSIMPAVVIFGQGPQVISLSANSGSTSPGRSSSGDPTPDQRGWTDPALNHNKLLQNSSEGMYKLIGPYKVVGTSFLFGERNKGDMFSTEAKAYNVFISYNTYNQEVEFYSSSNPNKSLVREPGTLDSFTLHENIQVGINRPLKFIYGTLLGIKEKLYYQEIYAGSSYSLYKRYKSDLGYNSNNLAQSELRQFDLQTEYYYSSAGTKGLKKIKPNAVSFTKEFKDVKDLSAVVNADAFTANPEEAMRKAMGALNNK